MGNDHAAAKSSIVLNSFPTRDSRTPNICCAVGRGHELSRAYMKDEVAFEAKTMLHNSGGVAGSFKNSLPESKREAFTWAWSSSPAPRA